jgi:tRNA(fMet)-specific endonuclease VapC
LTRVELEGGIHAVPTLVAERQRRWARLLPDLTVLPLDPAVVAAYVDIVRQIGFSRRPVIDRLIAATAIIHDLPLATLNAGDFRDVPGLTLEEWPGG